MGFEIKWKPRPLKFLSRLPKEIASRILLKMDRLMIEPFRYLEHYEGGKLYKLRIGDYRMLVDVDFERSILFVEVFDKRGRMYK